jgi:hypothetical protein
MVHLGSEQIRRFREDGYLVLPGLFAFDEIAWVRDEAQAVALRHVPRDPWPEEAPEGTIYGAHRSEAVFRRLAAHPRLVRAARDLLDTAPYIHQTRLLPWRSVASTESRFRRDAQAWAALDGLVEPRALTAAVVIEDAAYGSPLSVVPGSHQDAVTAAPVALEAGLGSVVLYDANLSYALGRAGDRPYPRLYLVSFNAATNALATSPRGTPYTAVGAEALTEEADDCLWPTPWCAAG